MLSVQRRNQDALLRIRAAVVSQEHALAEQMAQRKAFKAGGVREDDHMAMYQDEYKGSGGFAGPDSKKRRGVSSPFFLFFFFFLVPCFCGWLGPRSQYPVSIRFIPVSPFVVTNTNYRKQPLLVVATVVTELRHPNGAVVQTVLGLYATHVDCTMPSWRARWVPNRHRPWVPTLNPKRSTPHLQLAVNTSGVFLCDVEKQKEKKKEKNKNEERLWD